ncbi:MAG: outer membrane protein assembly factor BamE [Desulfomicrobium escambiense]|nr:outer membrane protein assembly factor BamE [Desulfomicrobium escambiense]
MCLLTVGCDNLSQENYNKIKVGMSLQEVEKLLGSSPTCDWRWGMKTCTWGTAEKHVKVQFVADKVAMYSAKGLGDWSATPRGILWCRAPRTRGKPSPAKGWG